MIPEVQQLPLDQPLLLHRPAQRSITVIHPGDPAGDGRGHADSLGEEIIGEHGAHYQEHSPQALVDLILSIRELDGAVKPALWGIQAIFLPLGAPKFFSNNVVDMG